jgi:hypothetical protein
MTQTRGSTVGGEMKRVVALALLGLVGCGERAKPAGPPAAVAPPPERLTPVPAPPITVEDAVDTPACLGFERSGRWAYVLMTNYDPGIPEWYVMVPHESEFTTMVQTTDPEVAKRGFAPLVERLNAFIRESDLVACTTTKAGPEQRVEVTVRGVRTVISLDRGTLVIAPEGQERVVRPQTETTDIRLMAVYTAPTLPFVAIVMRDLYEGVVTADRLEWVRIDRAAPIAQ